MAVSIVKNEADIIEAFVRHTLAWVDRHLIFDHDSTDGTREILLALRAEGLPIRLFTDDALANLQQARSNHLVRLATTEEHADWILPLDADEILTGPGRPELELLLATGGPDQPASLPLLNYYPNAQDDAAIANPVLRLRHCQAAPSVTRKIMISRSLSADPAVTVGKGSHVLWQGPNAVPDRPLPPEFYLAHLALRSPQHQALRVVLAELQKLSHGRAHDGLDIHYRLGFQLLAENPALFFATASHSGAGLRELPITYHGGPLRYSDQAVGWNRVARALLPYLEKLAVSHGHLLDAVPKNAPASRGESDVRELANTAPPLPGGASGEAFSGYTALEGLAGKEGPVPEAFLPQFHWGHAPHTLLSVESSAGGPARLVAEVLTYSEGQTITVEVNGVAVHQQTIARVNAKEWLLAGLLFRPGRNEIILRYDRCLVTAHDPRKLAVIFLSLRILPAS